ncbi:hypothetical protein ACE1AT_09175 [Pelatocladus sp. BLCC-F211]|uniref:hypothetical protein n=1 Tax=Pelatocladus sp. BLCC-F211 TaxID=3342752 RepID=UPI0035BB11F0
MQEDSLEELRKGFIEAIAAHKFIELKFGIDRSIEINKIKQQWRKINQNLTSIPDLNVEANYSISKYQVFELHLLKLQQELESTKEQLLEQQTITNNLIGQNSTALKQIQELIKFINTPSTLNDTINYDCIIP